MLCVLFSKDPFIPLDQDLYYLGNCKRTRYNARALWFQKVNKGQPLFTSRSSDNTEIKTFKIKKKKTTMSKYKKLGVGFKFQMLEFCRKLGCGYSKKSLLSDEDLEFISKNTRDM